MRRWIVLCLCMGMPSVAWGDVRLPALLGPGMVLQHGKPAPIWGWGSPGEQVTVHFAGQHKRAKADAKGAWMIKLAPLRPSKTPRPMVIQGRNRLVIKDVLIGEVWLCSGQSNMQWAVRQSHHGKATLARLKQKPQHQIRLFRVHRQVEDKPSRKLRGRWHHADLKHTRWFSAICYYFGAMVHADRKVPVGLIASVWGGTQIEAWMPWKTLASHPMFRPIINRHQRWKKRFRPALSRSNRYRLARWHRAVLKARAAKKPPPRKPRLPYLRPVWYANSPSALFNGMIYPLHPYAIRGVLWYQGESNHRRGYQYRALFPAMIEQWRWLWRDQFPFFFVQIAPYYYGGPSSRMAAPELCEAQRMTLQRTHRTGMVVTNDLANIRDIHPRRKREVARRLFLLAQAKVYGKKRIVYSGPLYRSMRRQGNKILLSFDHVGGGLVAKGGKLKHFTIAGKDRRFYPAKAFIIGDMIAVWSAKVKRPVAVRFAWRDNAIHNLFNKQGLPASLFRTDDWPGVSYKRR